MNAREAAFSSLKSYLESERQLLPQLEQWQSVSKPSDRDFRLAYELASGAVRMRAALAWIARALSSTGRTPKGATEQALLYLGLYQICFMEQIPPHAAVNETVSLARRHSHKPFSGFLNALLRQAIEKGRGLLDTMDAAARYSLPAWFVERMEEGIGEAAAAPLFVACNQAPPLMVRVRPDAVLTAEEEEALEQHSELPPYMRLIRDSAALPKLGRSPRLYVQNATSAHLMHCLAQGGAAPKRILDLCASPGGKLVAAHDLFPQAQLFANDLSEQKLRRLKENCEKYALDVEVSFGPGELYERECDFDLVIVDLPCSNSGVLAKRAEARWRLGEDKLAELALLQKKLLKRAFELVAPEGEVWLLTCSVLKEENERLTAWAQTELHATCVRGPISIFQGGPGWEGG